MPWHLLTGQLTPRVSNMVYLLRREFIKRTSACEIPRMRAMCASLNWSQSESDSEEGNDTGEMHVVGNRYENTWTSTLCLQES